ncbi:MAG: helix-turn-helix domain-containing protein, partial [Saprospiraceae bacterium]
MSSDQGPADLKRMYRIFKFIQLLSAPPYYKVVDLAQRLDVSKKTVYNYINLLEEVGFQLDKNEHDQYFL